MTTYTRQCDGHPQKCPRSPQCGLDCDFNSGESNPGYAHTLLEPVPEPHVAHPRDDEWQYRDQAKQAETPAPEVEDVSPLNWRGFLLGCVAVLVAFFLSGGWK